MHATLRKILHDGVIYYQNVHYTCILVCTSSQDTVLMGNVLAGLGLYGVRDFPPPFVATVAIELLSDEDG